MTIHFTYYIIVSCSYKDLSLRYLDPFHIPLSRESGFKGNCNRVLKL